MSDASATGTSAAPPEQSAAAQQQTAAVALDEVMLAMDVVDTLRHQQELVVQELSAADRDKYMLERLRQIYSAQGIEVPERILREGVVALREDRFTYKPPERSLAVRLAHVYVRRRAWTLGLLAVLAVAAIGVAMYRDTVVRPQQELVRGIETSYAQVLALAEVPEARSQAQLLYASAQDALRASDRGAAREAQTALAALQATLASSYTLNIVSGANETTGVWRIPDVNLGARNYYLIVEATGPNGRPLAVPVRSEETGQWATVSRWGLRVDQATFERVAADKQDDGIIQDRLFGEKQRGRLEPDYRFPTTGAAITSW